MSASNAAADIIVEGHVQGVGFRNYAYARATALGLGGYVRNMRDGRVHARVEGPRDVVADFVRALEKGPPLSRVDRVEVRWLPPSGRFAGFDVRYSGFQP